eukprot:4066303-Pyramimonas_sp.AAC.1
MGGATEGPSVRVQICPLGALPKASIAGLTCVPSPFVAHSSHGAWLHREIQRVSPKALVAGFACVPVSVLARRRRGFVRIGSLNIRVMLAVVLLGWVRVGRVTSPFLGDT